ncbi:MAG: nucleoside-diphosphate sugar epimerase [Rhodospirillales bacterium CG15_BIG_FIL_POST_REV_8_21_14_020_66_15]|nr:MAG: nucleoside-diphosphate sugar epimerase [Rhodospirillales bacterium CG15_BIG_FIL_POST_REV_8_21_14_020_66_15]
MSAILTPKAIKTALAGERVALVGGAGFIGHNLALGLREYGASVLLIDNLMQNNLLANISDMEIDPFRRELNFNFLRQRFEMLRDAGVEIASADARSMIDLENAFRKFSPTKIVHLAAISSAVEAKKVPGHCFDLQLITLRNVLEYTQLRPDEVNQVVFMSSSTVYGDFKTQTVDESVRPQPYGIYANTKFMGERLVRTYNEQYGLNVAIIRPSALYGERCISRRVSQAFIENALMGKPLLLEGGGDGRLDFTYILDLVDGIIRSMAVEIVPGASHTFNITFGNARTILELANIVKDVVPTAELREVPRDKIKPIRGTLSTQRAKEHLNFEAKWSLETGYRRYCEWYVEQWERVQAKMGANLA